MGFLNNWMTIFFAGWCMCTVSKVYAVCTVSKVYAVMFKAIVKPSEDGYD